MTIPQFKKWLKEKIAYADNVDQFGHQTDFMDDLVMQAREYAVDLGLPEAAAACRKGPATVRLMEVLDEKRGRSSFIGFSGEVLSARIRRCLGVLEFARLELASTFSIVLLRD